MKTGNGRQEVGRETGGGEDSSKGRDGVMECTAVKVEGWGRQEWWSGQQRRQGWGRQEWWSGQQRRQGWGGGVVDSSEGRDGNSKDRTAVKAAAKAKMGRQEW